MRHYYNKNRKNLLVICPILNLQGCKESKPNLMENQKDKEDYMELIKATTDSIENKEDKVIKNICKNIYIKNDLLE